jgi:hypothetical protein
MEKELHGVPGFFPEGWDQIATFALDNGLRTENALEWAEQSIQRGPMFSNQMTKARALDALGRTDEAEALRLAAVAVASESDVDAYVQARRRSGQTEDADHVQALFDDRHIRLLPCGWIHQTSDVVRLRCSSPAPASLRCDVPFRARRDRPCRHSSPPEGGPRLVA